MISASKLSYILFPEFKASECQMYLRGFSLFMLNPAKGGIQTGMTFMSKRQNKVFPAS
jgi:hypothetical protein